MKIIRNSTGHIEIWRKGKEIFAETIVFCTVVVVVITAIVICVIIW